MKKRKVKYIMDGILLLFMIILPFSVMFSPIVVSLHYNNPWLLLLFAISWIPAIAIILGIQLLIEFIDLF